MEWTSADITALQNFTTTIDSDDIYIKEKIKSILLNNRFIIHVLNNEELESEEDIEADAYFGVNILPYYMIQPTQTNVQNFICFETNYDELDKYNSSVKKLQIIFHILCHQKNIIDEDTNIPRHDLLAALIQNDFNYATDFGSKIRLISDVASVVDSNYASRTMIFEQLTDNNLVKSTPRMDIPRLANKDVDNRSRLING